MHGAHVGSLGQHGSDVWFRYDEWLLDSADRDRWRLSVKLPITADTYGHEETLVFFDNLLLESDTREAVAALTKHDPSDLPGLLGQVGGECAGAVALWPVGMSPPQPDRYREIPPEDLDALFTAHHGSRLTHAQLESRQSFSGVQHKLVFRRRDASFDLPLNGAPGTHILKRGSGRYDGLAINEWFCLRAFQSLELPVPACDVVGGPDAFLAVERYDRVSATTTRIERVHQEDFCQATGRRLAAKYQVNGGPGFADLAATLRRHSIVAAADLGFLLGAIVANVLLGNMDAHAKNFALLATREGLRLAPFYDIVCTEAYPGLDLTMSMKLGHSNDPRRITEADLIRLAKDMKVSPQVVRSRATEIVERLALAYLPLLHDAALAYGHAPVLDRIAGTISMRIASFTEALTRHPLIQMPGG